MKPQPGRKVLAYMSVITHFESFAKGVLDIERRDLLCDGDFPGTVLSPRGPWNLCAGGRK